MTNNENARREHLYLIYLKLIERHLNSFMITNILLYQEKEFSIFFLFLLLSGKYALTPALDSRSFGSRAMVSKGV